jgi:arylsulfatase A-like enzyme
MQEHGIPITFSYISDAHGDHSPGAGPGDAPFGPGEAGYVAQLQAYDHAFDLFFQRLAADGITKKNTLFVITADEGDHFVGGPPSPAGCDGVNVPCTYAKKGEIDANMTTLINGVDPTLASTQFDIHFDMAPTFDIIGNPAVGSPTARAFERAVSKLTAVSPITGNTDVLTRFLADPVELNLLHMITGDPQRTPNFIMFGDPDYFFDTSGTLHEETGFAWNHGGVAPEINNTWLGIVGPGVRHEGITDDVFSDHTDIRPTILSLFGLTDDYVSDGRVLVEAMNGEDDDHEAIAELARVYKAITAPVGPLGLASLSISTKALASGDATNDAKYTAGEAFLADVTTKRDALVDQIKPALDAAEFHDTRIDRDSARRWVEQGEKLLALVAAFDASF